MGEEGKGCYEVTENIPLLPSFYLFKCRRLSVLRADTEHTKYCVWSLLLYSNECKIEVFQIIEYPKAYSAESQRKPK